MKVRLAKTAAPGSVIDLDRLIESRLLVQGASGSGKSTLARQVLEKTVGKLQQIIIDPEGEFSTLRKLGDYLLCGVDGDIPTEAKSAALLAKRIRSSGVSAIVDIYELKPQERHVFVARFLEGMMSAPKRDWHECLLFIDETHVFAPQARTSDSLIAVQDMAARGRKRKIGLICATQRLSKLHKDVAAELRNRIIGQTGLKNDLMSAAIEMGLTYAEAREALLRLKPGQFWSFGPALAPEFTLFQCADTKTHAATSDTLPGRRSASLSKVIASLADLPKQAAKEAQTLADLRQQNVDFKKEIRALKIGALKGYISEADAAQQTIDAIARLPKPKPTVNTAKLLKHAQAMFDEIKKAPAIVPEVRIELDGRPWPNTSRKGQPPAARPQAPPQPAPSLNEPVVDGQLDHELTTPQRRVLDAIAWMEAIGVDTPEQTAVAFLSGYTFGGGAFNNQKGSLKTAGLVEYVGKNIRLTDAGRSYASPPSIEPTSAGLHAAVMARLSGPHKRVLQPLLDAHPTSMSNDELQAASGYSSGGAFNNAKGRLRSLGLIEYPMQGSAVARSILFPDR